MAVIRVEKNRNYTTICNECLRDKRISLRAKGLLVTCLSLPDDWNYSVNGLAAICKEGRDAIMTILKELEATGYITRKQTRLPNGKLSTTEYLIHERSPWSEYPTTVESTTAKPTTDKPITVKPSAESTTLLNTNKQKKEYTNQREKKELRHKYGTYENVLLSEEELLKLQSEFPSNYKEWIERLSEYMASTGKNYKNHLATIRSWARKEKPAAGSYRDRYQFSEGESL